MSRLTKRNLLSLVLVVFSVSYLLASARSPFVDVVKQNRNAVVQIKVEATIKTNNNMSPFGNDDFFKFYFPQLPESRPYVSLGSGFIFNYNKSDNTAYIMTNNHVVDKGKDGKITVTLADKKSVEAEIVGLDPDTDLAVIKIEVPENEKINTLEFGNSDQLEIGEWAIAIGNPFGDSGLERTVTVGVVSALGRAGFKFGNQSPVFQDFIQTDAAINPGNSGGPLLDIDGKVIGINAAITSTSGGNVGIGFAIPQSIAEKVASDLMEYGYVKRAYLGIIPQEITEDLRINLDLVDLKGVLIAKVEDDSPAAKAKLEEGDVIIELNGAKVQNVHKFRSKIAHTDINSPIDITIIRNHKRKHIETKLDEHPSYIKDNNDSSDKPSFELGIEVESLDSEFASKFRNSIDTGVIVKSLSPGSYGQASSLQVGDVILEVNGTDIETVDDFNQQIDKLLASDDAVIKVLLRVALKNNNRFVRYIALNLSK